MRCTCFLAVLLFFCITSTLAASSLRVSDHDIQFQINKNGTFTVFPSSAVSENITIWFNYTDGCNLVPLPDDQVIEEGTTESLVYTIQANAAGHCTITVQSTPSIDTQNAFVRVSTYKVYGWIVVSSVIGWLYFICWSISFYPQIIQNYRRKSVVGLNFDFLALNITGFLAYSVFNIGFRYVQEIQSEYHSVHPTGVIPVELNDVVFAVHAAFATAVTIVQCFIYERGDQYIAKYTVAVLALVWSTAAVFLLLTSLHVNKYTPWLTFMYFFSYVKLGVTLTKYIPQAIYNYRRKSTTGWSIGNILLDFVGGSFSIVQMFIISYNYNDWYSIIGNLSKFGLGVASIAFDIIFMVQHYILYRHGPPQNDSMDSGLIT